MLNQDLSEKAYFFANRTDRFYYSGKDIAEGYFLVGKQKAYFTDARYFADAKRDFKNTDILPVLLNGIETVKSFIQENKIKKIITDFDKLSVSEYCELLTVAMVEDGKQELFNQREVKTDKEIGYIKKACKIAQKAYYSAIKQVRTGMSELELKEIIEKEILRLGADGVGFETIVAFDKGSAVPHHVTGKTKLKRNSVILVDMGAKYKGYISDLTRTAFFGNPSKKFLTVYGAVLKANELAEEIIVSGMTTDKADAVARDYLKDKGLDRYFIHSLGHGVGLEVHEAPTLSPNKSTVLRDGAVFTIEPGVYIEDSFGVRIEDTVLLRDGKVEKLFNDNKKLLIIKDKS